MNIFGNPVGNLAPRTDYEQTDPTKADYLQGRDVLDKKIQEAKDKAGQAADAAEALGTTLASIPGAQQYFTATLAGTGWTGTEAPYSQTVAVAGILESDRATVDVLHSESYETACREEEAWAQVYRVDTADGSITAKAHEKPGVNITIQLAVLRIDSIQAAQATAEVT